MFENFFVFISHAFGMSALGSIRSTEWRNELLTSFKPVILFFHHNYHILNYICWNPLNSIVTQSKLILILQFLGIISLLDEECLRPGEATDFTFLTKMNSHLASHKHYFSYDTSDNSKVSRVRFLLCFNVLYNIEGILSLTVVHRLSVKLTWLYFFKIYCLLEKWKFSWENLGVTGFYLFVIITPFHGVHQVNIAFTTSFTHILNPCLVVKVTHGFTHLLKYFYVLSLHTKLICQVRLMSVFHFNQVSQYQLDNLQV